MNVLRIDVYEEDRTDAGHLADAFRHAALGRSVTLSITVHTRAGELMESIEEHGSDLVILSIRKNSKQLDGLTVAQQLRRWDVKLPLAFVSDCSDYAIHGYSVQALNFLVKPVKVADAAQLLGMVLDSGRHHSAAITVVSERVTLRVPVASILYAESKRNRIVIHTSNQDIPTYMPLSRLEASGGGIASMSSELLG
ncbi:LytR/AlgR family response regulator transcription factor [Bifidobacterium vansinderenii]